MNQINADKNMSEFLSSKLAKIVMDGDGAIFRFGRPFSGADDRHRLEDCLCFNLHVPVYVEKGNWPAPHGPAHPGYLKTLFRQYSVS